MLNILYANLLGLYVFLVIVGLVCLVFEVVNPTLGTMMFWLAILVFLSGQRFASNLEKSKGKIYYLLGSVAYVSVGLFTIVVSLSLYGMPLQ
jgi:membrane-bound ClpP family serine protease